MIIAAIGAGGKTTLCNHIGKSLARTGHRALFTTTTKIFMPQDSLLYLGPAENIRSLGPFMTAAKGILSSGKLEGYSTEDISAIAEVGLFDDIIVEADGAARMPIKAPNDTEPVYPISVDLIIGVVGLDSIGQPIDDQHVHRAALFSDITQAPLGAAITPQHIVRLISHPNGLFRHAPADTPRIVFLNKCDTMDEEVGIQAQDIIRQSPYPVMLTGYHTDWFGTFFQQYLQGDSHAY